VIKKKTAIKLGNTDLILVNRYLKNASHLRFLPHLLLHPVTRRRGKGIFLLFYLFSKDKVSG